MSGLKRILYVSQARLADGTEQRAVDDIVASSVLNNRRLEIGGALLFTGHRFAQWIEGPGGEIDRLMHAIRSDPRHDHVRTVFDGAVEWRRFADWGMVHRGPSLFVDRHLKAVMAIGGETIDPRARINLERLVLEMAEGETVR